MIDDAYRNALIQRTVEVCRSETAQMGDVAAVWLGSPRLTAEDIAIHLGRELRGVRMEMTEVSIRARQVARLAYYARRHDF